jgi:excisionase family DNA binding protein
MAIGKLLTLRDAAEKTGHRESTYRAWVLARKVPFYKVGRSVRIAEADLERMLEQARVPVRTPASDSRTKSTLNGTKHKENQDARQSSQLLPQQ